MDKKQMIGFPLVALMLAGWMASSFSLVNAILGVGALFAVGSLLGASQVFDKITYEPMLRGDTYVSVVKYSNPSTFKEYAVIFDPSVVGFDAYSIQASYRTWVNRSIPFGRQTTGVEVLNTDSTKRIVHVLRSYNKPSQINPKYLNSITIQFFYTKRSDASTHTAMLQKFNAIRTSAQFVVIKQNNSTSQVPKTGLEWNVAPAIHAY